MSFKTGKNKTKKDTKKLINNYIILAVIFITCICLVLYLCRWYKVYDEYQRETPVIRGSLQEIISDDLEHYVLDNPSALIYICTSNDDACRDFEKDLKKFLNQGDYSNYIVYLNVTNLDQEEFVNDFNNKYPYKTDLTVNYPAFVLFEDGKVRSILQGNAKDELSVTEVKHFLKINKIGE